MFILISNFYKIQIKVIFHLSIVKMFKSLITFRLAIYGKTSILFYDFVFFFNVWIGIPFFVGNWTYLLKI